MENTEDVAALRATLNSVLRLADDRIGLEAEWRAALVEGDAVRQAELDARLLESTGQFEQLIAGVDLGEVPPTFDRRAIRSV